MTLMAYNAPSLPLPPMENLSQPDDYTSPDCFRLEELEVFQSIEGQLLADVNYYLWLNQADDGAIPYRFLYALELVFDSNDSLLLSSGEDSEAIRVIAAETLLETARQLQQLHGKISIQRVSAGAQPLWLAAIGKMLEGIRLSRNDAGLYLNDALLLDFGKRRIMVRLSEKEGLELIMNDEL